MTERSCERTEHAAEYALRTLPASERSSFETHIGECSVCSTELATLLPILDAFVAWPTGVLRPATSLWGRLAQRIANDTGAEPLPEAKKRWREEPAWKGVAPGITVKIFSTDEKRGRVSMLVRLAPGVAYPAHQHADIEELHLLDGELWIENRLLRPGDYNRAEPGTGDTRVFSDTGCTCVLSTSYNDVLR